jgi:hypothetical protein
MRCHLAFDISLHFCDNFAGAIYILCCIVEFIFCVDHNHAILILVSKSLYFMLFCYAYQQCHNKHYIITKFTFGRGCGMWALSFDQESKRY